MELGVFSLSDISPDSPDTAASRVDDIIEYGILAERHGLDAFGIGEHQAHRSQCPPRPLCTPRSPGLPAGSR